MNKKNYNYITVYTRKRGKFFHLIFDGYIKGKRVFKSKSSKTDDENLAEKMLPEFEAECRKFYKLTDKEKLIHKNKLMKNLKQNSNLYDPGITFCDFAYAYVQLRYKTIDDATYSGYLSIVKNSIIPYFYSSKILLKNINGLDIQRYYFHEMNVRNVSANTVIHYHGLLSLIFKYACKLRILQNNPLLEVEKPKKTKYVAKVYNDEEIRILLQKLRNENFHLFFGVIIASFFGLRRSEVVGLKWSAVNFVDNVMTITHTVTEANLNGKKVIIAKDKTKSTTSLRSFVIPDVIKELFLEMKERQKKNKEFLKRGYYKKDEEYICVNDGGELLKPNFFTKGFREFLKKNNMKSIRFHDLRHSCASILYANNVNIKDLQLFLGHSSSRTTLDIYVHLVNRSNINTVSVISDKIGYQSN